MLMIIFLTDATAVVKGKARQKCKIGDDGDDTIVQGMAFFFVVEKM